MLRTDPTAFDTPKAKADADLDRHRRASERTIINIAGAFDRSVLSCSRVGSEHHRPILFWGYSNQARGSDKMRALMSSK